MNFIIEKEIMKSGYINIRLITYDVACTDDCCDKQYLILGDVHKLNSLFTEAWCERGEHGIFSEHEKATFMHHGYTKTFDFKNKFDKNKSVQELAEVISKRVKKVNDWICEIKNLSTFNSTKIVL